MKWGVSKRLWRPAIRGWAMPERDGHALRAEALVTLAEATRAANSALDEMPAHHILSIPLAGSRHCNRSPNSDTPPRFHRCSFVIPVYVAHKLCAALCHSEILKDVK